jgi:hypothetical protein
MKDNKAFKFAPLGPQAAVRGVAKLIIAYDRPEDIELSAHNQALQ